MNLKVISKIRTRLLAIVITLIGSSVLHAEGGVGTGGGNLYVKRFSTAALVAIENIKSVPELQALYQQAQFFISNSPEIVLVKSLVDCAGKPITEPEQYAQSCKGKIQLLESIWKVWLYDDYTALVVIDDIFHEVLRVTAYEGSHFVSDENYTATNLALQYSDLVTNSKCEITHSVWLPAFWQPNLETEGFWMSLYNEYGSVSYGDLKKTCEKSGSAAEGLSLIQTKNWLDRCRSTDQKLKFTFKARAAADVTEPSKGARAFDEKRFILSRNCLGREKPLTKNHPR